MPVVRADHDAECAALVEIHARCHGAAWRVAIPWGDGDCCTWNADGYGVACGEDGRVVSVVLGGVGVACALPDVFAALPALELLLLDDNAVTELPASLFTLPLAVTARRNPLARLHGGGDGYACAVRNVVVAGNALDALPAWLGACAALATLDASDGRIRTLPPRFAPSLTTLKLPNNRLTTLPNVTGLALQVLDLRGNAIDDSLDALGDGCGVALHVDVSNNALRGTLPAALAALCFGPHEDARAARVVVGVHGADRVAARAVADGVLSLAGNALQGTLPPEWGNATRLGSLDLSANALHGAVPPEWGRLGQLQVLDVHDNALTSIDADVAAWGQLAFLDASRNVLAQRVPEAWLYHASMRFLSVAHNALHGALPIDTRAVAEPAAAIVSLAHNHLEGTVNIDRMARLTSLDVSDNALSGWFHGSATAAPLLVSLNISHNAFATRIGHLQIDTHTRLVSLDISHNAFHAEPLPEAWRVLERLTALDATASGLAASSACKLCLPSWCEVGPRVREGAEECFEVRVRSTGSVVQLGAHYFGGAECGCARGFVQDGARCVPCLAHGVCMGGAEPMRAESGYWATPSASDPRAFLACDDPDACEPHGCARGYRGRMCSRCADGYYTLGPRCARCAGDALQGVLLAAILLAALAFVGYVFVTTRASVPGASLFKLFTFHAQALHLLAAVPLGGHTHAAVLSLNTATAAPLAFRAVGIECLVPRWTFAAHVYAALLLPLALGVVALLVLGAVGRRRRRAVLRVAAALLYTLYGPLLVSLRALSCRTDPVTGAAHLRAAPDVHCSATLRALAGLGLVVYGAGIPALFMGALASRDGRTRHADVLGWLCTSFKGEFWYWEGLVLARRFLLAGVLTMATAASSAAAPLLGAFVVLFASVLLQALALPSALALRNRAETISLVTLTATAALHLAALERRMWAREVWLALAAVANACVLVGMLAVSARRWWHGRAQRREDKQELLLAVRAPE